MRVLGTEGVGGWRSDAGHVLVTELALVSEETHPAAQVLSSLFIIYAIPQ